MIDRERHFDPEEPTRRVPDSTPGMTEQGSPGYSEFEGTESGGTSGNVVDMAKQRGGRVASDVQEKSGEMMDKARHQASSRLSGQMDRAAEGLDSVAHAVRQTGSQLRTQDQTGVAEYADKAADQIERFSTYLRDNGIEDVAYEVEHFARRQPLLFLGGAFVAGFLGARFLKSSSPRREFSTDYRRPEMGPGHYGRPRYGTSPGFMGPGSPSSYPNREMPSRPGGTVETGQSSSSLDQGSSRTDPFVPPPTEHTEKADEAA